MNECSHVTKNVVNTFQFTKACLSLRIFLFPHLRGAGIRAVHCIGTAVCG